MFIDCTNTRCRRGRIKEHGFDGWDVLGPCPDCRGAGEIELTAEEAAIMRQFLDACAASIEACQTVADVEGFLAAPVVAEALAIDHPNMTPAFFDTAVKRAMDAGLCIQTTGRASVVAVSSATDADVSYLVTREACTCKGHSHHGRCYHRALAIAWWDVFSKIPAPSPELLPAA